MKLIAGIIVFSIIILFHELGHFLLAKKNGVRVYEFSLGLGPTLIGKEFHGTKYCINILPFGGACVMKGEEEGDDSPDSFQAKTPWQRFQVIFAGPFFNFILAFLFSAIIITSLGAALPIYQNVYAGAKEAGIQPGDQIVQVDNKRIHHTQELTLYGMLHQEKPDVNVIYKRDGKEYHTTVTRIKEDGRYILGVSGAERTKVGPIGILTNSFYETKMQIDLVFESFGYLFSGHGSVKDISGPVGIVKGIGSVYDDAAKEGVSVIIFSMMNLAIMLSANLGVMNLLPIPALDGGRLVMIIAEVISKKKVPIEIEAKINKAGLVFLLGLITLITFKDIFV